MSVGWPITDCLDPVWFKRSDELYLEKYKYPLYS